MLSKKFWLRLLNVDQGEWWVVKNLMILQFLQGAGIAFFFTASFASFLERFGAKELPWVMIASAFMLWGAGFLYTKAEHALPFPKLVTGVTLLMALTFLVFRMMAYTSPTGTFLYWMLASFHVLYLLNNLQFWGIATIVFDLRQSKRLFGLISSGDIPAKFVGYTLALFIVHIIGTMNLLYLGAGCLLASLPFLARISRSGKLHIEHEHHGGHHGHHHGHQHGHQKEHEQHNEVHHSGNKLAVLFRNFMNNVFIRDIAFLSMLAFMCLLLIDFGFYYKIKYAQADDQDLATFIAAFMAILRLSALLAKMIFTGRVTNSLGIRQTLLITPSVMMTMLIIIVASQWADAGQKTMFYLFGATAIIIDVCRTVFNGPVLLTLMQPLPTHERLRAHNIVKGIMDPFAFLLTGIILLALIKLQHGVSLITISYLIIGIGCLWIPAIFVVNRRYLNILVQTISSRYFSQEEFTLKDEAILQAIRKKIASGNDLEVISILKMLHSKKDPVAADLVNELLEHPSAQVKLETMRLISGSQPEKVREKLRELFTEGLDDEVKKEAIRALSKTSGVNETKEWLDHGDRLFREAALSGMLVNTNEDVRELAEKYVEHAIRKGSREEKCFVAAILEDVKDQYSTPLLHRLITDEDPQVQALAIRAVGKTTDQLALKAIMEVLPDHLKPGLNAFQSAGEHAVPVIHEAFKSGRHPQWHEKFIVQLGRIGGVKAQETLVSLLDAEPARLAAVIKALYRTRYKADEDTHKKMETLARLYLVYGVELLHMQRVMKERGDYPILERSIEIEIQEIRELLLCLFACMFDRVKMNQARKGLNSSSNENIANAMELIELTVKKDIGRHFNHLFETTSIQHRCDSLRALVREIDFDNVENILSKVLLEQPIRFQHWTKAVSLYMSRKYLLDLDRQLIGKYVEAENKMVRETAEYALETR